MYKAISVFRSVQILKKLAVSNSYAKFWIDILSSIFSLTRVVIITAQSV